MSAPQYGSGPHTNVNTAAQNTNGATHTLTMRQEPKKARVVVRGKEKDRKPVDPPPVVMLKVNDNFNETCSYLHNPYYFCTVTLWDAENDVQIKIEPAPGSPPAELLQGQLVSSLHRLKDFDNSEQGFFVFSDISVGTLGSYRLRFSLYEYRPSPGDTIYLAGITSEKFEVVAPKDWDGVRESTALSRSFADQGVRIRLRKESRHSSKRQYPQTQGQNIAPQTPLRPHPQPQPSFGSGGPEQGAEQGEEPPFKRQRSFAPGAAQGQPQYLTPNQPQQAWSQQQPQQHAQHQQQAQQVQQQSGYPAVPQQTGMYPNQPGGNIYANGPYFQSPYGGQNAYPAPPAGQATQYNIAQAGYGSNGSTPQSQQQQQQQYAGNPQRAAAGYAQSAQAFAANAYPAASGYPGLSQRYGAGNTYASPQPGAATLPSNYQQTYSSPFAANQQIPVQGQQPRYVQGQQYAAGSGQPSPAHKRPMRINTTPRGGVVQSTEGDDSAAPQLLQQRAAGES